MKKILSLFLCLLLSASIFSESRNALLIANGKYSNFSSLATPVNEARGLKVSLEKLGFTVTVVENAGREEMFDSIADFEKILKANGGIGFFHYGGHAVQVNGKNYLIPVDANISDEEKVKTRAVDVEEIMTSMKAETNIVVLDACRNNPLPAGSGRSASRGLVVSSVKPKNSIIIYSAAEGRVAQDGVFTPILTEKLLEQKSLTDVLIDVRKAVREKTDGEQNPGEYNELNRQIYLAGYKPENNFLDEPDNNYISGKNAYDKKDYKAAFKYASKSAEDGNSYGQTLLAVMFYNGEGVKQDYSKAFEYYNLAASRNNKIALNNLGDIYAAGSLLPKDYLKAKELYEKSAEQGYDNAQWNLGNMYYNGIGVQKDYIKASQWFEKSAAQGDSSSQFFMGLMYLSGNGVTQDYAKAKEFLEKSAMQENKAAQFLIGYMYLNGNGVTQDYTKAAQWFEKSALNGNTNAQEYLGLLYLNGYGVPKDYAKGKELIEKSAAQGNADAQQILESLNK